MPPLLYFILGAVSILLVQWLFGQVSLLPTTRKACHARAFFHRHVVPVNRSKSRMPQA